MNDDSENCHIMSVNTEAGNVIYGKKLLTFGTENTI